MGSGGSFVAILLSVPLTAVALVGVIGVPKLQEMISPASSSHHDDELESDGFSSRSRSKRSSSRDRAKEEDAELWGDDSKKGADDTDDFGSKPRSSRSKAPLARGGKPKTTEGFESDLAEDSKDDFFSKPGRGRSGSTPREPAAIEMASTDPFKSRTPVVMADHATATPQPRGDTFTTALEKLRAMGVDQFHLVPGLGAGQYLFVCQIESASEAGTVHRFEAEAVDPALAVADVMRQVAAWQSESSVTKSGGGEFRR